MFYTIRNRYRKTRKRGGGAGERLKFKDKNELRTHLEEKGVDREKINAWGAPVKRGWWEWIRGSKKKHTKALSKLLHEIKQGETDLVSSRQTVRRRVKIVHVKVYNNESKQYSLYEMSHYDPKTKTTKKIGDEGVREKMKKDETKEETLKRGIKEELGEKYSDDIIGVRWGGTIPDVVEEKDSRSYPGLMSRYESWIAECYIPELVKDHPPGKPFTTIEMTDHGKRKITWEWKKAGGGKTRSW